MAVLGLSYAAFGVAWAFGGEDAVSDTLVGTIAAVALIAGILTSLVAFVAAIVDGFKPRRWALLWLPLGLLPALLVIVVLIEVLWME